MTFLGLFVFFKIILFESLEKLRFKKTCVYTSESAQIPYQQVVKKGQNRDKKNVNGSLFKNSAFWALAHWPFSTLNIKLKEIQYRMWLRNNHIHGCDLRVNLLFFIYLHIIFHISYSFHLSPVSLPSTK